MVEIDPAQVRKEVAGRSCEMYCHGGEDTVGGCAMLTLEKTTASRPLEHRSLPPFTGPALDAFCRVEMRAALNAAADPLQADLDVRLYPCNAASLHLQSRDHGQRPIATVKTFVCQES